MKNPRRLAGWLWLLLLLFCLRVLGQALVVCGGAGWLPPLEQWQSGLLPYPWLLATQLVIIALYARVCVDFTRGGGFFVVPRRGLGTGLLIFGFVYFAAMVVRLVVAAYLYPGQPAKWKLIPITLHWVLAGFILLVGRFHRATSPAPR